MLVSESIGIVADLDPNVANLGIGRQIECKIAAFVRHNRRSPDIRDSLGGKFNPLNGQGLVCGKSNNAGFRRTSEGYYQGIKG